MRDRGRQGIRDQRQERARARQRTTAIREGLDALDTPDDTEARPGPACAGQDLGAWDEADGDALLQEDEECGAEEGSPAAEGDLEEEGEGRPSATLATLLGSAPPVVLVRLVHDGEDIGARLCARPASREAAEALEELRRFLEHCFHEGRERFAEDEWQRLLGLRPAPLTERLLLLSRLALPGNAEVVIPAARADGGEGHLKFTPHDRGLHRYAAKFAALPDGVPFSVGLLLADRRGRAKGTHPFARLPDAVKLLALRRALRAERETGTAGTDDELRTPLRDALEGLLGVPFAKPAASHVTRFREALVRNGAGHLFPNQRARQQEYDRLAAAPPPAAEAPS